MGYGVFNAKQWRQRAIHLAVSANMLPNVLLFHHLSPLLLLCVTQSRPDHYELMRELAQALQAEVSPELFLFPGGISPVLAPSLRCFLIVAKKQVYSMSQRFAELQIVT